MEDGPRDAKDTPGLRRRRLRAVFAADVANFGGLVSVDETKTLDSLWKTRRIAKEELERHGGWLFGMPGDGIFALFESAIDAVRCALGLQSRLAALPELSALRLRIGVHLGEVLFQDELPFGESLVIAARLESLAEPGGILVSSSVMDAVAPRIAARFVDKGAQTLKHSPRRVVAYAVLPPPQGVDLDVTSHPNEPLERTAATVRTSRRPAAGAPPPAVGEEAVSPVAPPARPAVPPLPPAASPPSAAEASPPPEPASPPEPAPALPGPPVALPPAPAPGTEPPAPAMPQARPPSLQPELEAAFWDEDFDTEPTIVRPMPRATPLIVPLSALDQSKGTRSRPQGDTRVSLTSTPVDTAAIAASIEDLTHVLTTHLGPVARILVKRMAEKSANPTELIEALAQEIPVASERDEFVDRANAVVARHRG